MIQLTYLEIMVIVSVTCTDVQFACLLSLADMFYSERDFSLLREIISYIIELCKRAVCVNYIVDLRTIP